MIVIDRRDDPLFTIYVQGVLTLEDLCHYRTLCEELETRDSAYVMVWADQEILPHCLHTWTDYQDQRLPPQADTPTNHRLRFWNAALSWIGFITLLRN